MSAKLKIIRTYYGIYSAISPAGAAKSSFSVFQKVRKKDIRPREEVLFDKAKHFQVKSPVGDIDCYHLGEKNQTPVLLVHGLDSNAGSMSNIAFDLAAKGHSVYLFNLPGHAFYSNNKMNIMECSIAMTSVLEELKLGENLSIISHSFGSAVTALTLANSGIKTDRIIFLTNPNSMEAIFINFKNMIGLGERAYRKLVANSEKLLGTELKNISVVESLKKSNFNELYLIHDKFDKVLPYSNSLEIKAEIPNAHLETLEKIGHYKMLWNEEVLQKCNNFLN